MRMVLLFVLAACSGKSPTPTTPPPPNATPGDRIDAGRIDAGIVATPIDAAIAVRPAPVITGCPTSVTSPAKGSCELGKQCPFSNGNCFCDGYHGGIPPRAGVDYSHWVCGKTIGRKDGCPDDLKVGAACKQAGKMCHPQEGMWCGPEITCTNGTWTAGIDDCSTIP